MATTIEGERLPWLGRLLQTFRPGERVRAVNAIIYGTGEEVKEGTCGHVQQVNVHGCGPLVTVAWEDRGGKGQAPHIIKPCSVESLERVTARPLDCATHGSLPWHGEVICIGCNAVWKLEDDAHVPPAEYGTKCTCGEPLTGRDGTARAICPTCYLEMKGA